MDCWLVKVGPSCGLVDDFIHEHSKSAAEYPASSSLSTNLHGLQVISPGKIDLKNLHMDMAVNMGIYSLKHGNFIREKDDKPVDLAGVPKNFRHTHILHPFIFARKNTGFCVKQTIFIRLATLQSTVIYHYLFYSYNCQALHDAAPIISSGLHQRLYFLPPAPGGFLWRGQANKHSASTGEIEAPGMD